MTTLAQQLEALRTRMADTHGDEMYLVTRLAAEIAQRDAEMMREVEAILLAHEQRRADIVRALHTLAARIGHVPVARFQHDPVAMSEPIEQAPEPPGSHAVGMTPLPRAFTHGPASAEVH